MKRMSKVFVILGLATFIFTGCQKGNDKVKPDAEVKHDTYISNKKDNTGTQDKISESKLSKKLKQVEGSKLGSVSSYVEDRQVWNDFIDKDHIEYAKLYDYGIHLPRILLESDDAKKANEEIDEIAARIKEKYEEHKKDIEGKEIGAYATFSVYQDEKVLSIMIENYDIWSGEFIRYKVYNFSLPDGNFISDDELMADLGVSKDQILPMVENSLREDQALYTSIYYRDTTDYSYIYNPSNYTGLVLNDLWDNYENKKGQIYIDEVGKPTFLFDQYKSSQMGYCSPILKLNTNDFDQNPISDEYIRMATKLGIDPYDDKYKAFMIYLGGAVDEDSLKDTLEKLNVWTSNLFNYKDPSMLVTIKESQVGDLPYLIGEECYLLIPKYKNASIALKELEISEDGKLKEVDNIYLDSNACCGPTFICQNMSDLGPNGKITIRYRDDVYEFSPSLSMKDGTMTLPDEVLNGEEVFDWSKQIQNEAYSPTMYDIMRSLIGVG
ncbi:hypothetical protein [Anaerococcus sp. Marseille-P3915]|uniref:hypothetical protein n=1 Tax=Anaerococcus sp. Marseille-P3915 TaxID=2057799 RepID=UPI000D0AC128|nr:hypothetical protein [Anaerococcus sp. Marseille-P3915]